MKAGTADRRQGVRQPVTEASSRSCPSFSTIPLAARTSVAPSIAAMFCLDPGSLRRAVQIQARRRLHRFRHPAPDLGARPPSGWRRVAGALSALGMHRGDRVAILALNNDRYFELMYAMPWIGAVMVPLNTRLAAPGDRIHPEGLGRRRLLFIDGAMAHHLTALEGRIPAVREVDLARRHRLARRHAALRGPHRLRSRPRMSARPTTISPASSTPAARPAARRA